MFRFFGLLGFCLLGMVACAPPSLIKDSWVLAGPMSYAFEDDYLRITLQLRRDQVQWHFTNKRDRELIIDHKSVFFAIKGDPASYNLWGAPFGSTYKIPPITIPGGGFMAYQVPINFHSPLRKLVPSENQDVCLYLTASWSKHTLRYQVQFPFTPEEEPGPEAPQD